jgi:integrase
MYELKIGHLCRLLPQGLADLTPKLADEYFQHRRDEEDASISTLYKEWVALRQVLKSAARRGHFVRDIGSLKPRWVTPKYEPRERFLRLGDIAKLCSELAPERAAVIRFVVATGARRGEAFRAHREDVDLRAWVVKLRGTKTAKSKREIPIPTLYRPLLSAAVKEARKAIGKPMFEPWENARRDIERAAKRAGVKAVTWNDLRRSFASLLVQAGASNVLVAKLLGHADTTMVDRVYGRVDTSDLATMLRNQIDSRGSQVSMKKRSPRK